MMSGIRLHTFQLSTSQIVKMLHQRWISSEGLGRGHILNAVPFPETIGCTECSDAGLCGESGAGKNDEAGVCEPGHDW